MNGEHGSGAEESIIAKIISDSEAQAKRVIDNAARSARGEERKARSEGDRIRREILEKAESKASTFRSKVIATGNIEAKRMLLTAREEAISMVLDAIEQELGKIRENPREYRKALSNLAVEAISAVAEPNVTLKIGKQDQDLVDDAFLAEITKRTVDKLNGEITIALERDPALTGGGCVAIGKQGRIVFDNTFARRLERMKPALRSMIVREVLRIDA